MKVLLWIVHHLIRPFWSIPIGLFFWYKTLIDQERDLDLRDAIRYNRIEYNEIKSLSELLIWLSKFTYYGDGFNNSIKLRGALDHDNMPLEFFAYGGDCDDSARYSVNKLRELGFKAHRVHIWTPLKGKKLFEWMASLHYIVYFTDDKNRKYIMNYSKVKEINSIKEGVKVVAEWYKSYGYDYIDGNICLY